MDLSRRLRNKKAGLLRDPLSTCSGLRLDQRGLCCGAHVFLRHTFSQLDDFEAAFDDIQHTEVGDDAVNHAFTCERQGALFEHLAVTVFVGVNLIQSAFTGICPAAYFLKKLGFK